MPDRSADPLTASMPMTSAIGAHASVPILLPDGQSYELFCCIGQKAKNTLNDPNLQTMTASTEFASFEINRELNAEKIIRDILPD
jgi:hypothetical protein